MYILIDEVTTAAKSSYISHMAIQNIHIGASTELRTAQEIHELQSQLKISLKTAQISYSL